MYNPAHPCVIVCRIWRRVWPLISLCWRFWAGLESTSSLRCRHLTLLCCRRSWTLWDAAGRTSREKCVSASAGEPDHRTNSQISVCMCAKRCLCRLMGEDPAVMDVVHRTAGLAQWLEHTEVAVATLPVSATDMSLRELKVWHRRTQTRAHRRAHTHTHTHTHRHTHTDTQTHRNVICWFDAQETFSMFLKFKGTTFIWN